MSSTQTTSPADATGVSSAAQGSQELDMMAAHKRDIATFSGSALPSRSNRSGLIFNKQDGQFHYEIDGRDLGVVSSAVIDAINANRHAQHVLYAALRATDIAGYDETPEEEAERVELYRREEDTAIACVFLANGRADLAAVEDHAHEKGAPSDTVSELLCLPKRWIKILAAATQPDDSTTKAIATLIEDHREANAALNAISAEDDPDGYEAAYVAEQRAAVLLAARSTDDDITTDDLSPYDQYKAVYGQDDQHRTSLTWCDKLPDSALQCLRQHYRPTPASVSR